MLYFATLFDKNYLSRGLALLESLRKNSSQPFMLYVLALDEAVVSYFQIHKNPHVQTISLQEIEEFYPELVQAKNNRKRVEYYFTLSPYIPSYILQKFQVDRITTLDSDIYFFDDPGIIFNAYPAASILITPHGFSDRLMHLTVHGKYNVSFQSFKNNQHGNKCLAEWRKKCVEWCYDELDLINNRYADQKYLDSWPDEFKEVEVIQIPGTGLAPWNLDKYSYSIKGNRIFVNDCPLVYFHFHHLRIFNSYFAINAFEEYQVQTRDKAIKKIYQYYLERLNKNSKGLFNTDNTQVRYTVAGDKTLFNKLVSTNGYWFYTNWFIFYVNPQKNISKVKYRVRKLYGSITKSNYVHR
jgi:hypothetical protein